MYAATATTTTTSTRMTYPTVRRDESVVDTLHGRFQVRDPYRWLEDPDATEVVEFVKNQQTCTSSYFEGDIKDSRDVIRKRMEELYNYPRASCPIVRGSNAFVYRNTGLQNQDVLYKLGYSPTTTSSSSVVGAVAAPAADSMTTVEDVFANCSVFMDLNSQFPDGTTALSSTSFSHDGSLFAFGLSRGGSDWVTLYIRDVESGKDLDDTISYVKFSGIKWSHDNKGFFYSRYPAPPEVAAEGTETGKAGTETAANRFAFVCYHRVGTSQSEDVLIYANPSQPNWRYGIDVTEDGEYLLLTTVKGTDPVNRLYYCHLPTHWDKWIQEHAKPAGIAPGGIPPMQASAADATPTSPGSYVYLPFVRVFDNFEAEYDVVANDGARFYLRTNLKAHKYRIVCTDFPADMKPDVAIAVGVGAPEAGTIIDMDKPSLPTPTVYDVVPEHAEDVLDWAAAVAGNSLVLCYMHQVVNILQVKVLPTTPPSLPTGEGGGEEAVTAATAATFLIPEYSDIPLPAPGTVASFAGRRDQDTVFVKFVSFLHPGSILRITFNTSSSSSSSSAAATGSGGDGSGIARIALPGPKPMGVSPHAPIAVARPTVVAAVSSSSSTTTTTSSSAASTVSSSSPLAMISPYWDTLLTGFDSSNFEAKQVFVPSKDGSVKIPMFLVYKKGLLEEAKAKGIPPPCLQYGYGGFNISLPPSFSSLRLVWLQDCGGVYALANIRGGGELGEDWHKGGMKLQKQNCFDDFSACTQWLIDNGYTSPRRVAILGGSNGGLLTLATSLQFPSLYGAAVSQVPVADMMRFHKFTIGSAWRGEYGFAEEDAADCENMLKYSPLHNVKAPASSEQELPSILITTADHDDRVVPLHSFKMAAELQAIAGPSVFQHRPLMIRVESKAGHGAGKPTSKVLDEYADVYAFIAKETGAQVVSA